MWNADKLMNYSFLTKSSHVKKMEFLWNLSMVYGPNCEIIGKLWEYSTLKSFSFGDLDQCGKTSTLPEVYERKGSPSILVLKFE